MRKRIAVLGSTGWVGKNTLRVARHLREEIEVVALAAKSNGALLYEQAQEFSPQVVALVDKEAAFQLQKKMPEIPVLAGMEGLDAIASLDAIDFLMLAVTGSAGLMPAVAAIRKGKSIGLANKETLVCGGEWIRALAKEHKAELIPVDSEHSALHQCLRAGRREEVRRLILTASGGAFRTKSEEELKSATLEEALTHPTYAMGPKVLIDCATLMNKGLEIIEAKFLFDIEPEKIEAVIHPESVIHSLVEFVDGSLMAQMADPDMALPIQYALTYPERKRGLFPPFDFFKKEALHFFKPNEKKYPCLGLATAALRAGRSYPCFLNAANEVIVERFLRREIPFTAIGEKLEKLISSHKAQSVLTLDAILSVDFSAREMAARI